MNKGRIAAGLVAAVIGGGLLWAVGSREDSGITGWEALNVSMEQAMGMVEPTGASVVEGSDQQTKNNAKTVAGQDEAVGKVNDVTQAEQAAQAPVDKNSKEDVGKNSAGDGMGADGKTKAELETNSDGIMKVDGEARTESLISEQAVADSPPVAVQEGKVNVNVAGVTELMELPGIGEKKAQAIIDYRNLKGAYHTLSDLGKVKGIGPKMLEKLKVLVIF